MQAPQKTLKTIYFARRLTIWYIIISALWIVLSDVLVINILSDDLLHSGQIGIFKGLSFVCITGLIWYSLLRREEYKRRQAEDQLISKDRQLQALIEQLPVAMWMADTTLQINTLMGKATDQLGRGENVAVLFAAFPELIPAHGRVLTGQTVQHEINVQDCVFDVRLEPVFDGAGNITGCLGIAFDITMRKQAEQFEISRTSEALYRQMFEQNQAVSFIIDPEHACIVDANPAACAYYGYARTQFQTMSVNDINQTLRDSNLLAAMERTRRGEQKYYEVKHILSDGTVRDVELFSTPVHLHDQVLLYTIVFDVTARREAERNLKAYQDHLEERINTRTADLQQEIRERKQLEAALRESEARFRSLVMSMDDVIFTLDTVQTHTGVYGRWVEQANFTEDMFIGKTATDIMGAENSAIHMQANTEALRGDTITYEWSVVHNGQRSHTQTRLSPIYDDGGEVIGLVGIGRDITNIKVTEEKLRREGRHHALLSQVNHVLVHSEEEPRFLDTICQIIVEIGGYQLTWIGYAEEFDDKRIVVPMASYGDKTGYVESVNISWGDDERGRGPTGRAIRTGQPQIVSQINVDENYALWRDAAQERGYASSIALPVHCDGWVFGALNIYADHEAAFDENEIQMLMQLAENVGYGITTIRARTAHEQSHRMLERRVIERTTELSDVNANLTHEITEREIAEASEREQRKLLEALADIVMTVNSTLDMERVLDRIHMHIGRVLPHEASSIMRLDGDTARAIRADGYERYGLDDWIIEHKFVVADTQNLAYMFMTQRPLLIQDTLKDRQWRLPPPYRWVRSYIGMPLVIDNEIFGFINLHSTIPGFFDETTVERLRIFTDHTIVALKNAHLYENAHTLAVLEERQRLARDLHDAVTQTLFSASVVAETLQRVWQQQPEKISDGLENLKCLTRGALAEMRSLLMELRPKAIEDTPLGDLLYQLADAFIGKTGIPTVVAIYTEDDPPLAQKLALYRIVQEGLNNISKHARAQHVHIDLLCKDGVYAVNIEDDGRGFDPDSVSSDHMGLHIMSERAQGINASLAVATQINRGTTIHVEWSE